MPDAVTPAVSLCQCLRSCQTFCRFVLLPPAPISSPTCLPLVSLCFPKEAVTPTYVVSLRLPNHARWPVLSSSCLSLLRSLSNHVRCCDPGLSSLLLVSLMFPAHGPQQENEGLEKQSLRVPRLETLLCVAFVLFAVDAFGLNYKFSAAKSRWVMVATHPARLSASRCCCSASRGGRKRANAPATCTSTVLASISWCGRSGTCQVRCPQNTAVTSAKEPTCRPPVICWI